MFLGIALEHDGDDRLTRKAACVEQHYGVPAATALAYISDQCAKAGPILVSPGLDNVGILADDQQAALGCKGCQLTPLGVDRYV